MIILKSLIEKILNTSNKEKGIIKSGDPGINSFNIDTPLGKITASVVPDEEYPGMHYYMIIPMDSQELLWSIIPKKIVSR